MDIRKYLASQDDTVVAAKLGVTPRAVMSWRLGERFPRPIMLWRLHELSQGEIDIVESVRAEAECISE